MRDTSTQPPTRHARSKHPSPLWLLVVGLVGCASAPVTPPAASTPPAAASTASTAELFALHVSPWVDLYEQLYFEAHPPPGLTLQRPEDERWTPAERQAWDAAVAAFREHTPEGTFALLSDPALIALRRALDGVAENGSLAGLPGAEPALVTALEQAAGPYRAHYWPQSAREGQAWVSVLEPELRQYGPAIARELSEVYGAPWPQQPFSVQVCRHASIFGAYTLVDPTVITVSTLAPPNRKVAPLETTFHEASHALMWPLMRALAEEFRRQGQTPPEGLWHALLFFTTGEVVRRHLGPDYVPYAHLNGLYARNPQWAAFEPVMRREWIPYLEHKVDLQTALRQLVAGYVPPASPPRAPTP